MKYIKDYINVIKVTDFQQIKDLKDLNSKEGKEYIIDCFPNSKRINSVIQFVKFEKIDFLYAKNGKNYKCNFIKIFGLIKNAQGKTVKIRERVLFSQYYFDEVLKIITEIVVVGKSKNKVLLNSVLDYLTAQFIKQNKESAK